MSLFNMGKNSKATRNPFAEFIRNAKSDEKKRVYSTVITESTKQQNQVIEAAKAQTI
ncbi:hypothetical protein [Metapseudomonas resinovorans]|uniref:Uncharacterized protein n=1 Tax=Metapseudomonas resinovorans NBRC 106553 TaxID=1245471 RepID=S6BBI7_METRE|nr:hypothetical protein [Pseudomonas resinovorans]BAN46444.1 hypothetical protein PCA10_07120 [Pseudomonas resinovorans NBRC 106553]